MTAEIKRHGAHRAPLQKNANQRWNYHNLRSRQCRRLSGSRWTSAEKGRAGFRLACFVRSARSRRASRWRTAGSFRADPVAAFYDRRGVNFIHKNHEAKAVFDTDAEGMTGGPASGRG